MLKIAPPKKKKKKKKYPYTPKNTAKIKLHFQKKTINFLHSLIECIQTVFIITCIVAYNKNEQSK